jgi:hypothetical protein
MCVFLSQTFWFEVCLNIPIELIYQKLIHCQLFRKKGVYNEPLKVSKSLENEGNDPL